MEVILKILIIQLARLGDILLTWPQVRALKRSYPQATIDLLVRPKFISATKGLSEVNKVISFPVETIFSPLFEEPLQLDISLNVLDSFIKELKDHNYTWIINSTLSPASSYLAAELENNQTKISGYSRTTDGYLSIKDDVSSYIYAQVGIDRNNRIHLSDLFTLLVDLQPSQEDWITEVTPSSIVDIPNYIVVHVGASREDKKFSPFKWRTFISHFHKLSTLPVVLIGSKDEANDAQFISLGFDSQKVLDLTGKIEFEDLFSIIKQSQLFIGCDSAPLHIASLVGTQALNISFPSVNFWETGPKTLGSRVLYAESEATLASETVAQEAIKMLHQENPSPHTIVTINATPSYTAPSNSHGLDWTWDLVQFIYLNGIPPLINQALHIQGLNNLLDVNKVILDQFQTIRNTRNVTLVSGIIERCEEVIESVGILVPDLSPLIRWYQTQKSSIGPSSPQIIFESTEKIHKDFENIVQFLLNQSNEKKGEIHESSQS